MPTQVIRDGKTYYEYSPQELEKMRNDRLTEQYLKRGQYKFASSNHTSSNGKPYKHKYK